MSRQPSPAVRRIDPFDRAAALSLLDRPGAALLEGWSDEPGWRTVLPWPEGITALPWSEAGRWLEVIEEISGSAGMPDLPVPGSAPFLGGWCGLVSYDVGAMHEAGSLYEELPPEPPIWFAHHGAGIAVAPDGTHHLFAPEGELDARERELAARLAGARPIAPRSAPARSSIDDSLAGSSYPSAVEAIREAIACGDVYQVNLTRRFSVDGPAEPDQLYLAMTGAEPPRCSAYLRGDGWTILSASPEVFLRFDRTSGVAESRPIKGTVARDGADEAEIASLRASAKDESEHLMIVDLVRNDLGRVAPAGRVSVPEYKRVRTLKHVHHLESTVRAEGLQERSLAEVLSALFPAGSITGAPKRAAVHAIRELEPVARGVYTGAIGFVDARGRTELSVAIRTAVTTEAEVRYHAGGGIVWDSDPAAEDAECRAKSKAFLEYVQRAAR